MPYALTAEQREQSVVHAKDLTISLYSPDSSLLYYFAFPKLKMELKGTNLQP